MPSPRYQLPIVMLAPASGTPTGVSTTALSTVMAVEPAAMVPAIVICRSPSLLTMVYVPSLPLLLPEMVMVAPGFRPAKAPELAAVMVSPPVSAGRWRPASVFLDCPPVLRRSAGKRLYRRRKSSGMGLQNGQVCLDQVAFGLSIK
jgi:hypothetical protein